MVRLRVKELAEARGLNMNQVSRRTGLTLGMVRRYWYNETVEVRLDAIHAIAQLLDVQPGELFVPVSEDDTQPKEKNQTPDFAVAA